MTTEANALRARGLAAAITAAAPGGSVSHHWQPPAKHDVDWLLRASRDRLAKLPNVVHVDDPKRLTVVGDVHGQLFDVLELLGSRGPPSSTNAFLFNGDLVDRGLFGAEITILLFALALADPHSVFINRGNHESRAMTQAYGFRNEVLFKYGAETYDLFQQAFDCLPLGTVVKHRDIRALVLHGGLFTDPSINLESLDGVDRVTEPTREGVVHDVLWSDPGRKPGRHINRARGAGLMFGPDVTQDFLTANNLDLIVRSHQVREAGYSIEHNGRLVTIFSAPHYCGGYNAGAVLTFDESDQRPSIEQFTAVEGAPGVAWLRQVYSHQREQLSKSRL